MGVKDLWTVLDPVAEHCTMDDLRGKRLAVDISGWIFQSLQSPVLTKKPTLRPHLRNLFWRLHHLMRNQVRIIVVFDGPSPKLKSVALAKRAIARRQQREKGQIEPEPEVDLDSVPIPEAKAFRPMNASSETYFGNYCTDCKEMLRVFRIPYVVSTGDAESTCAYLNRLNLVDGCITDDNDAFLFGASVVYRHYTCDKKRLENLKCYRSECIKEQLGLTQDHLIAMGLILGCDYGLVGIKGIGKERTLEVLQSWGPDCQPLERLKEWRFDNELAMLSKFDPLLKPEHCRLCGHLGNIGEHKSVGCNGCARQGRACARSAGDECDCSCEYHQQQLRFKKKQVEIKIMKAAIEDINFPDKDIIESYKQECPDEYPGQFVWSRPNYAELQRFVSRLFSWDKDKVREKMAMYFTSFDLMAVKNKEMPYEYCSQPEKIISKRVENGQNMYEVEWKTIPDLPLPVTAENPTGHIITRESKDLFEAVFPELVTQYEEELEAKKNERINRKRPSRKRKKNNDDDGNENDRDGEVTEKKDSAAQKRSRTKKKKVEWGGELLGENCDYVEENIRGDDDVKDDADDVEATPKPKRPRRKPKPKLQGHADASAEGSQDVVLVPGGDNGEVNADSGDGEIKPKPKRPRRKPKPKMPVVSDVQTMECFLIPSSAHENNENVNSDRKMSSEMVMEKKENVDVAVVVLDENPENVATDIGANVGANMKPEVPNQNNLKTSSNIPPEPETLNGEKDRKYEMEKEHEQERDEYFNEFDDDPEELAAIDAIDEAIMNLEVPEVLTATNNEESIVISDSEEPTTCQTPVKTSQKALDSFGFGVVRKLMDSDMCHIKERPSASNGNFRIRKSNENKCNDNFMIDLTDSS